MRGTVEHDSKEHPLMRVITLGEFALERLVPTPSRTQDEPPRYTRVARSEWSNRGPAMALLKVLLCQANRRASRDELIDVKANLLLTHFGNLKWTHPHGGERESVFLRSERATPLICSAMAAQSVPSEEPGIKVAPLLFALLTPGSSDGLKNAPIAFSKKTTSCFFAQEE